MACRWSFHSHLSAVSAAIYLWVQERTDRRRSDRHVHPLALSVLFWAMVQSLEACISPRSSSSSLPLRPLWATKGTQSYLFFVQVNKQCKVSHVAQPHSPSHKLLTGRMFVTSSSHAHLPLDKSYFFMLESVVPHTINYYHNRTLYYIIQHAVIHIIALAL